jgi:hypothetical protein
MKMTIDIPDSTMIADIWEENLQAKTEVVTTSYGLKQIILSMNKSGLISLGKLFFHLAYVDT